MATTIKLRKIGNSVGFILPKVVAEKLRVVAGDTLHLISDVNGARLTAYDPDFEAAMNAFRRTRRKFRNALRTLAK